MSLQTILATNHQELCADHHREVAYAMRRAESATDRFDRALWLAYAVESQQAQAVQRRAMRQLLDFKPA